MRDAAREAFVAPRVAVIEDDSVVRHELTQVLAGAGYRVNAVADGENGLHAVHEHQPDLLILSLAVPRLDAFELLRRLRADHRTATLPVLAMTERTSFDHRMRAFDAGADDVILKPCHPLELLARIRGPLRRHDGPRRTEQAHAIVVALSNAVEAKDSALKDHCRHMTYRAARLGAFVGLRGSDLESVAHGALLHDIGKIAIPVRLLHKVEPLTDDEWGRLRRHPEIGANICGPLQVARDIAPIIRHHHERWDGSGYPDGLRGEEIPLGARIVALADAYDVIVRGRPYQDRPEPPGGGGGARALRRYPVRPYARAAVHRGDRATRVRCTANGRAATGRAPGPGPAHRPTRRCGGLSYPATTRARIGRRLRPHPGPGGFVYHLVRLALKAVSGAYVRVRVEGAERLPATGGYLVCFNHPSWLDPVVIAGWWPDRTRLLYIFGPREADMSVGIRNHLITWTGRGIPFRPRGADALDATRRSLAVLRAGAALAVAGEGRLSDHEGAPLPFEPGVGHFAMLAKVPIVPLSIDGTRWVRFGGTVRLTIGEPIDPGTFGSGRTGATRLSETAHAAVLEGLAGVTDRPPPGRFGAWLSELFNDRPWLDEPGPEPSGAKPPGPDRGRDV